LLHPIIFTEPIERTGEMQNIAVKTPFADEIQNGVCFPVDDDDQLIVDCN
jgi:hypothetical protein